MSDGEWVILKTCTTRSEAQVVQGLLAAHGIESTIQSDDLGGLRPELSLAGGAHVLVRANEKHFGLQILAAPGPEEDESE